MASSAVSGSGRSCGEIGEIAAVVLPHQEKLFRVADDGGADARALEPRVLLDHGHRPAVVLAQLRVALGDDLLAARRVEEPGQLLEQDALPLCPRQRENVLPAESADEQSAAVFSSTACSGMKPSSKWAIFRCSETFVTPSNSRPYWPSALHARSSVASRSISSRLCSGTARRRAVRPSALCVGKFLRRVERARRLRDEPLGRGVLGEARDRSVPSGRRRRRGLVVAVGAAGHASRRTPPSGVAPPSFAPASRARRTPAGAPPPLRPRDAATNR
jgi:hypothetical protein